MPADLTPESSLRAEALALCEAVGRWPHDHELCGVCERLNAVARALAARLAVPASEPSDEAVARELAAAWGDGINSIQMHHRYHGEWAGDIVAAVNAARERARSKR